MSWDNLPRQTQLAFFKSQFSVWPKTCNFDVEAVLFVKSSPEVHFTFNFGLELNQQAIDDTGQCVLIIVEIQLIFQFSFQQRVEFTIDETRST